MMKALYTTSDFAVIVGLDLLRWYVGCSVENQSPNIRAFVARIGPFYVHFIHQS